MIEDIFISPHADDVAYSCYGALNTSRQPVILTIFGKSKYVINNKRTTHLDINDITQIRKDEDSLFAEMNNAHIYSFDFPDSSITIDHSTDIINFKNPYYQEIKESVINFLKNRENYNIYAPIGNGWHWDHILTNQIIIELINENYLNFNRFYLYEDLPYYIDTIRHFSIKEYFQSRFLFPIEIRRHDVDMSAIREKWKNQYRIYESQFCEDEFNKIHEYKISHKNGRLIERLWEIRI